MSFLNKDIHFLYCHKFDPHNDSEHPNLIDYCEEKGLLINLIAYDAEDVILVFADKSIIIWETDIAYNRVKFADNIYTYLADQLSGVYSQLTDNYPNGPYCEKQLNIIENVSEILNELKVG